MDIPMLVMGSVASVAVLCGFYQCSKVRLRDCSCIKRLLRRIGHDMYDDFELTVFVHEAVFDKVQPKMYTMVRVTAGLYTVKTDKGSRGNFQQALHVFVEQGTQQVVVDLLSDRGKILANISFEVGKDLLEKVQHDSEVVYKMKQKSKLAPNPKAKLTFVVNRSTDLESGPLLQQENESDIGVLVRQQLRKARLDGNAGTAAAGIEAGSEKELVLACAGPVEMFDSVGNADRVHAAIATPPRSKKWLLGMWRSESHCQEGHSALCEVDLLKIQSVNVDPSRPAVFVLHYFDENRVEQNMRLRHIDRAREVWVDLLQQLISRCHERKAAKKRGQK